MLGAYVCTAEKDVEAAARGAAIAYSFPCCGQTCCARCAAQWCYKLKRDAARIRAPRVAPLPSCPFCRASCSESALVAMGVDGLERADLARRHAEVLARDRQEMLALGRRIMRNALIGGIELCVMAIMLFFVLRDNNNNSGSD